MTKQTQKSGDNSVNSQVVVVNNGITYSEAREIAIGVFKDNFLSLSATANKLASERAEGFIDDFLVNLKKFNNAGIGCAQEPDFQYVLYESVKQYARSGEKELGDLLISLLIERTKYSGRTTSQIALNESLSILSKITNTQLAILSIIFLVSYTIRNTVHSLDDFWSYLDEYFRPLIDQIEPSETNFQHLEFLGCIVRTYLGPQLGEVFQNKYSFFFSKGFYKEVPGNYNSKYTVEDKVFAKCLHDSDKYQISYLNVDRMRSDLNLFEVDVNEVNKLANMHNSHLMSPPEIYHYIKENKPYMEKLFHSWDGKSFQGAGLTTVGITLAHANIKNLIGDFPDISVWLKDQ